MDAALADSRQCIGPRLGERGKQAAQGCNGIGTRPGRASRQGCCAGRLTGRFHPHSVRVGSILLKFRLRTPCVIKVTDTRRRGAQSRAVNRRRSPK
jgi:hypothetical protein